MLSPLNSATETLPLQHKTNYTESYSTSKESSSSQSETRADGTTVTKLEYSTQRSSYTVSFSSSDNQVNNKDLTYTNLSQNYQLSSLSVKESEAAPKGVATESTTTKSLSSSSAIDADSPLLDGAKNILRFIEQRIANEKADGASEGELAELWEQGLKGFVQGFNEAYGILEETGQLANGAVSESIETLSDQVYAGFDAIYEKYIGGNSDSGENKNTSNTTDTPTATSLDSRPLFSAPAVNNANGPRQFLNSGFLNNEGSQLSDQFKVMGSGGISSSSALSELVSTLGDNVDASVEYGRKDTFTFELKTLDGDTISINASNTAVFVGEYTSMGAVDSKNIEGMRDKNNFEMDIVGELDEQERVAIEDLLSQVMSLADEFYNGDIDKAYEAAIALGYDQNEIASYSIKLRQSEQFSVAAAYQDLQPAVSPDAKQAFASIGDFAQSVLETLNNPENYAFFDYTQLLKGISEQIDQQIKPASTQSFKDAIEQLVDTAGIENLNKDQSSAV